MLKPLAIVRAFAHPLSTFGGASTASGIAAVSAVAASACVACLCCIPLVFADPGPALTWASETAPAARVALTQSASAGTQETGNQVTEPLKKIGMTAPSAPALTQTVEDVLGQAKQTAQQPVAAVREQARRVVAP
jgi:hypothetical protein